MNVRHRLDAGAVAFTPPAKADGGVPVRRGRRRRDEGFETAEQTLQYSIPVGRRTPLHCTAGGKALLASLPAEELDRYFVENTLTRFTPDTVSDRGALLADLERIRERGFAKSTDEYVPGISAIAVAVHEDGVAIGAVSVAVPTSRFSADVEAAVVASTRRTAALLEQAHVDT